MRMINPTLSKIVCRIYICDGQSKYTFGVNKFVKTGKYYRFECIPLFIYLHADKIGPQVPMQEKIRGEFLVDMLVPIAFYY